MGKGDKRSRKGKIWRKSFGKTRPRQRNAGKAAGTAASAKPAAAS